MSDTKHAYLITTTLRIESDRPLNPDEQERLSNNVDWLIEDRRGDATDLSDVESPSPLAVVKAGSPTSIVAEVAQ